MAALAEYLKHLREQKKPQPQPESLTVEDTLNALNEMGVSTDD